MSPEPSQRSATGWGVAIGVFALAVGVAAAVFAESAKLDVTKALVGGAYIKETYRLPLLIAGISVGLLGLILVIVAASGAQGNALRGLLALTATGAVLVLGGGGLLLTAYENRPAAGTLSARPAGASQSPQSPDPDIGRVSCSSTGSCDQNGVPVSQPTGTAVRRDGQRCGWSASAAPPPIGDNHPYYDYECSTFNVPSSPPADTTTPPSGGTSGPPAAATLCHGAQACGGYDNDPRNGTSCGDSATAHLARVRTINLSCTEAKRIAADVAPTTSGADGFLCSQTPEGNSPTYVCTSGSRGVGFDIAP